MVSTLGYERSGPGFSNPSARSPIFPLLPPPITTTTIAPQIGDPDVIYSEREGDHDSATEISTILSVVCEMEDNNQGSSN